MKRDNQVKQLSFVVCDDEQAGCDVIVHLLKQNGATRISSFNNPKTALSFLAKNQTDVAFLDIKMPQISGLDLARRLNGVATKIIFVTAYQKFAVTAFELNVLDYLTKPVSPQRLAETLRRIVASCKAVDQPVLSEKNYQILVKEKAEITPLWNYEIQTIESAGKYSVISTVTDKLIWRKPISEIETLVKDDIVRIHRSTMINIRWISKLSFIDRKWFVITLDEQRLAVSEKYRIHLKSILDNEIRDSE